jgi:hypothetical protein
MTAMKISQAKLWFGFVVIVFLFGSCARNETANTNSTASNINQSLNSANEIVAKDDVEELGKIIKLPIAPEEATYKENDSNVKNSEPRVPASNEKKMVAVLKFSTKDAGQIAASAEKYKSPAPADVEAESWFPPELIAKSQISGDEALKGVSYAADDFLQPPFNNGKLTRINNTDYFVLELASF